MPIKNLNSITVGESGAIDVKEIAWNPDEGTFDMGLLNDVVLQAGQEMHFYGKAQGTIADGDAVMFAGAQGDHLLMTKATQATINSNPEYFIGIATQDFTNNQFGYVTSFGKVRGLDTTIYRDGDPSSEGKILWFDSEGATAGTLTTVTPEAPNAKIRVAAVTRDHQNQGSIFVRPMVEPKLTQLQDVETSSVSRDDILTWNDTSERWENGANVDDFATAAQGDLADSAVQPADLGTMAYEDADDYVDLITNQTIGGLKTFEGGAVIGSDSVIYDLILRSYMPILRLQDTNGHNHDILSNNSELRVNASNILSLRTAGTERLRIDGSGNVGIGTTSPSEKLEVDGDILADGYKTPTGTSSQLLVADGGVKSTSDFATAAQGTLADSSVQLTGDQTIDGNKTFIKNLEIKHSSGLPIGLFIENNNGYASIEADDGKIIFDSTSIYQFNIAGNQLMRLLSNGNLGIGTSAPTEKLEVNGNIKLSETAATTDTDKFAVLDSGVLKYRTGGQVLSDIGAQPSGTYNTVIGTDSDINTTDYQIIDNIFVTDGVITSMGTRNLSNLQVPDTRNAEKTPAQYRNTALSLDFTDEFSSLGPWYSGITLKGWTDNYAAWQLIANAHYNADDQNLYFRTGNGDNWQDMQTVWTDLNLSNPITGSGTANYLPKFSDADSLENSLIYDNGTNVGIGTTSPQALLHIQGAVNQDATKLYLTESADFGSYFKYNGDTNFGEIGGIDSQVEKPCITFPRDGSYLSLLTASTERLRVDSSGNVGIGTTAPVVKLDVRNNSNRVLKVTQEDTSLSNGVYTFEIDSSAHTSNMSTAGAMAVDVNSGRAFTINGLGNVGIGTTSPAHTLSVNGTVSSDLFRGYTYPNNSFLDFDKDDTAADNYTALASIGRLAYLADTNANEPVINAAHEFFTGASSIDTATSLMIIKTDGNVGIGTTSPSEKLHVEGNQYISGKTIYKNPDGNSILGYVSNEFYYTPGHVLNSWGTLRSSSNNALMYGVVPQPGVTGGYLSSANNVSWARSSFETGNAFEYKSLGSSNIPVGDPVTLISRFKIDNSTGNVGIGTTNPNRRLSVAGSIELTSSDTVMHTGHAAIRRGSSGEMFLDAPGDVSVTIDTNNNNTDRVFNVRKDTGSELFRVQENGNVGIGTTSPVRELDIEGDINLKDSSGLNIRGIYGSSVPMLTLNTSKSNLIFGPNAIVSNTGNGTIELSADGSNIFLNHDSNIGATVFSYNSSELMRINSSGNVGIGTTSPTAKLDVNGDTKITGTLDLNDGSNRTIVGTDAGGTGGNQSAFGYLAGRENTGGNQSVFGFFAGRNNAGVNQSSFGHFAGQSNTGSNQSAFGYFAGRDNIGADQSAFGYQAGYLNTGGNQSAFGYFAGRSNTGANNSNFGFQAGYFLSNGSTVNTGSSNSLFLGANTKANAADGTNEIVIGEGATGIGSNTVTLGNDAITTTALKGNVGIGTTSPTSSLVVSGDGFRLNNTDDNGIFLNKTGGSNWNYIDFRKDGVRQGYTGFSGGGDYILNTSLSNADIVLQPSNTEVLRVSSNGNVGIGTTSPTQKLHVNDGGIRVEKFATGLGGFVSVGNATETAGNYSAYFFGNTSNNTGYFKGGIAYETLSTTHGRGDMHFLQRSDTGSGNANISHSVMTILNGGNVGIGTTSPSKKLTIGGIGIGNTDGLKIEDPSNTAFGAHYSYDDSSSTIEIGGVTNNTLNDCISIARDATRTITIDTSERVGIGTTTPSTKLHVRETTQLATAMTVQVNPDFLAGAGLIEFLDNGGSTVGSIYYNGASTNYNTSSDYRLKENVVEIQDASERLKLLKPVRFNFINRPEKEVDGFIAHEVQEVIPEAITGQKDEVDRNGKPKYQGIDQSKIVPLLTAALKEAITKIEKLETRIQALENK